MPHEGGVSRHAALARAPSGAIVSVMPYRDARSALESRRDDLRRELDELRPRTAALRDAARVEEAVERELAATEARLAQMDAPDDPLLEDMRIASPCKASWDAMKGEDHVRFCGACEKNVFNLSALTREAANRLLADHGDAVCVRLYRREDGTVLTADCPVGRRRKRVRLALYGATGAGALMAAATMAASMVVMGMPAPRQHLPGGPAMPEGYVPQPLSADPASGLAFVYRQDPTSGVEQGVEIEIWADGHVVVEGIRMQLAGDRQAAVQQILALAGQLRPDGAGAVSEIEDSAVPRRYELFGTGTRQASDGDRARLFNLASRVVGRER